MIKYQLSQKFKLIRNNEFNNFTIILTNCIVCYLNGQSMLLSNYLVSYWGDIAQGKRERLFQRVKIAYFLLREKAVAKIAFALEQHYQYIIIQKKQGLLNKCTIV